MLKSISWMHLRAVVPNKNVKDNGSLTLVEAYEHLFKRKLCYNLSWYVFFAGSETIYIVTFHHITVLSAAYSLPAVGGIQRCEVDVSLCLY